MLTANLIRFQKATYLLHADFSRCLNQHDTRNRQHAIQMIVVRLQDTWCQFVRRLIVLSASGCAKSGSGVIVSSAHGFTNEAQVEIWLGKNLGSRDADWHVSQQSISWAKKLKVSNYGNVASALGSTNSPETEMRIYRNFIVHRNRHTAGKVKSHPTIGSIPVTEIHTIPEEYSLGGKRVFEDWIDRFLLVAKVASS